MVYISAQHLGVKKNQDRTAFELNKVVICDGIGEFSDSAKAAEIAIENILFAEDKLAIKGMIEKSASEIVEQGIIGGTTLIYGFIDESDDIPIVRLTYIGNGSIYHMHGNFFELPISYLESNKPYLYSNLLIPHIDKEGVLLRHISHHSTDSELIPSFIELSLTGIDGDIVLLFSDGISTLEEDIVVVDGHERIWRNQSENVSIILSDLHAWLTINCIDITQSQLDAFLKDELDKLKSSKKLEDDASLGIIITNPVLDYYKNKYHAAQTQ
jgi:hypothetical protein